MKFLSSAQRVFSIKSSPFQTRVKGKTLDVDDVGAGGLFLLVFLVVSPVGGGAALLFEVVERVLVVGRVLVVERAQVAGRAFTAPLGGLGFDLVSLLSSSFPWRACGCAG